MNAVLAEADSHGVWLEPLFDVAFATPGGVVRLRQLILTLAMQGKLVPQDPKEAPVAESLIQAMSERAALVKVGKVRQVKGSSPIVGSEKPYTIPGSWKWTRLRDICHDWGQKTPDKEFTYIDVGGIDNVRGKIGADVRVLQPASAPSRARKIVKAGTVVYSTVRPYLLNVAIVEQDYEPEAIASTAFAVLHPHAFVSSRFVYHYLRSPSFVLYVESTQKGVAYPAISDSEFFTGAFPLPPFEEQKRIVDRIDELLSRCDELELKRSVQEAKRHEVRAAALGQWLAGDDAATVLLGECFATLISTREDVAELRKAILQLAVMGKLVPQDPSDTPASILLRQIAAEKSALSRAGKVRSQKALPPIADSERPCEIPESWEWVRVASISASIDYGTSQKTNDDSSLVPVYRMGNIVDGALIDKNLKYISPEIQELPYLYLADGDILFNRTNSYELVGKSAMYSGESGVSTFASYLIRVRMVNELLNPRFFSLAMNAPYFRETQIEPQVVQQCGQANFNGTKLSSCLLPLPPLGEQGRIVAHVCALMQMCDTLEQSIDTAQAKQAQLLDAVMVRV